MANGDDYMKPLLLLIVLALPGCGSIALCGEREYTFEVPSTIPFVSGAFKIKRSSDHVDCDLPPSERAAND